MKYSKQYDVRFIYKKRNLTYYLSLNESSQTLELHTDTIDIVGWDIKKALNLHYKNNPTLREWIISNQAYIDNGIINVFSGLG